MDRFLRKKMFDLFKQQPWLAHREEKLNKLIDMCDDISDIDMIFDLLSRFKYVGIESLSIHLRDIVDHINEEFGEEAFSFQLCAATADGDADSGQSILYAFKSEPISEILLEDFILTNSLSRAIKIMDQRKNIILLDEFAGTGETIVSRIKSIRGREKELKNKNNHNFSCKVSVCLVAAMDSAVELIKKYADDVYSSIVLKKGITDEVDFNKRDVSIFRMLSLEESFVKDKKFYRLGYGQTEALYFREKGNIPNNVFPVFWSKNKIDDKNWKPLFYRKE